MSRNKELIGLFSGSFDPFTNAHLDIVIRGSRLFDKLYVGVAINPSKKGLLPISKRVSLIKEVASSSPNLKNVEVVSYTGLTVSWAKSHGVSTLIRGVRTGIDFESEKNLYLMNNHLDSSIDTVFLPSSPNHAFISSTFIKELLISGGDPSGLVPEVVAKELESLRDQLETN